MTSGITIRKGNRLYIENVIGSDNKVFLLTLIVVHFSFVLKKCTLEYDLVYF
jgi:hypothetical protein